MISGIKNFLNEKVKKPIGNYINKIDEKVDPDFAKKAYAISRGTALFMLYVVFPVITLLLGVNAYEYVQGDEHFLSTLAVKLLIGFLWFFLIISYLSWFYFSKWNVVTKEMKNQIKEERKQIKLNKKLARKADLEFSKIKSE